MPFADLGHVRLCYELHGESAAPALVLIRGLGTQLIEWPARLIDAFAGAGLRVVTFDNRDAGLSTAFDGAVGEPPYRLEDMANDVVALLDALDIDRAHVLGISLGGMIAQHLAFAYGARLLSLVSVMSSSGNPDLPRPAREILALLGATAEGAEAVIALNAQSSSVFGSPGYPESAEERYAAARAAYLRSYRPDGVVRQMQAALADGSRVERLRTIRVPTLVIHGRDDPLIPLPAGEDTARNIPGARLVVVPGMGHNIPAALATAFARIVLDFIASIDRGQTPGV